MAWTYNPDGTNTSDKDKVRFHVSDVDINNQLVQDEEIEYILSEQSNILLASSIVADSIAKRLAVRADLKVVDFEEDSSRSAIAYAQLSKDLRSQAQKSTSVSFYAGGISKADKKKNETNTDRVKPFFTRNQNENRGYSSCSFNCDGSN